MLTMIRDTEGKLVEVTATPDYNAMRAAGTAFENRNDWKSLEAAEHVAAEATELTGKLHIATEKANCYPRFDVIECPAVGDEVSYSFNGDSYPCGKIVSISKSLRVIKVSDGKTFYRRHNSGSWLEGGCWTLIKGHQETRNPHF